MYHVDPNGNKIPITENFAYNAPETVSDSSDQNITKEGGSDKKKTIITILVVILIAIALLFAYKKMKESYTPPQQVKGFGFKFK